MEDHGWAEGAPPCCTQVECRGGVARMWRKDTTMQIFQICHSDAEEQKEDKRKLGKHRSYAKPCSSWLWACLATLWCCLNELLCHGLSGSGKYPGEIPGLAELLEIGPTYPKANRLIV